MTDTETTSTNCLEELMAKLNNGGLSQKEMATRYGGQSISPGLSIREFLQLLQIDGSVEKRGDRFYLKTIHA